LVSPVKELSPRPPSWNPSQRIAPQLEPSFIHHSKCPPHQIPGSPWMERGPHGERCPYPETFLAYLPGSTVKELHPRPPPRSLCRERCSIPQSPFIQLSKSPPPGFPNGAPMERDARLQSLSYITLGVPNKGDFPPGSLHRAPTERDTPPPEPLSAISQSPC